MERTIVHLMLTKENKVLLRRKWHEECISKSIELSFSAWIVKVLKEVK